ncbi:hypothetical protein ACSAZK_07035 [Methanosarcina sp. Mfa9]|uniref:hypothetical protein n=1 Tax=Methanosarcina sp. Mfa9 TaxID=3439063 RepID=UPI003F873A40
MVSSFPKQDTTYLTERKRRRKDGEKTEKKRNRSKVETHHGFCPQEENPHNFKEKWKWDGEISQTRVKKTLDF